MISSVAYGQTDDSPTNAFNDLSRKGEVSESMSPMRERASLEEMEKLIGACPSNGYFCFTENRDNSVRLFDAIPKIWAERDLSTINKFKAEKVSPNEFYVFQIAVFAAKNDVNNIKVEFSDLSGSNGKIGKGEFRCFNLGGVGLKGEKFTKDISVTKGMVQPLWIGVQIPDNASGVYKGKITVGGSNVKSTTVDVELDVSGVAVENQGQNTGINMSRLEWLDSRLAVGDSPTAPYIPVTVENNKINYLGGEIVIAKNGLPSSIVTKYDEMNRLNKDLKNNILSAPMEFIVESSNGREIFTAKKWELTKLNNGAAAWSAQLRSVDFILDVTGRFEFDGFSDFSVKVTAIKNAVVKDIRLKVPFTEKSSKYTVGMGQKGGKRTLESYNWSWDTVKHQDIIWLGDINAGLNFKFKDENYARPLVNIYYGLGRLKLPHSWGNGSKGGACYKQNDDKSLDFAAYSGERTMKKGDVLYYNFEMLVTPVKPINFVQHVTERYHHSNTDASEKYIDEAVEAGSTRINVHHKKEFYPYINYPYYDDCTADFKKFVERAESRGKDVGIYYTTRELSVKVPEIWALRSLGSEVIHDGPGKNARTLIHPNGPNKWLNDNFTYNFIPAWYNAFTEGKYKGEMDISVITTPDSRWNNYYLEGLNWMVKNLGIKGVYIDDSALDRQTMKRARRIIDSDGVERLIDIHSWNHFNEWAGYANSLHMYLDLLPYVDRTWIGEGFGEENALDFWMVEMAGIPYGLMSETLDAWNIFKGLVFGMTPRYGWSGDPRTIWKMYDSFGMKNAEMIGYWVSDTPINSGNENLPVTTYINRETKKAIAVVAQWGDYIESGKLSIDESRLGFKPTKATLVDLGKHQSERKFNLNSEFSVEKAKGVVILIE